MSDKTLAEIRAAFDDTFSIAVKNIALKKAHDEIARLRAELAAERERIEKLSQENAVLRCDAAGERARVAKLHEVLAEVIRISDRKHEAWDRARAVLAETGGGDGGA